jgi:hypothetical protein
MVTDYAPGGGAEDTMVTGKMTGSTTYQCPLDAAFGIGGCGDCEKRNRCRRTRKNLNHVVLPANGQMVLDQRWRTKVPRFEFCKWRAPWTGVMN